MTLDLNILNNYLSEGLVVKNDHPTLPISIWNYSRTCQYENKWDEITKQCRGLILDNEGNVVGTNTWHQIGEQYNGAISLDAMCKKIMKCKSKFYWSRD